MKDLFALLEVDFFTRFNPNFFFKFLDEVLRIINIVVRVYFYNSDDRKLFWLGMYRT